LVLIKKHIALVVSIVICLGLHSQDIHYSQFYNSPLNLNPSLTGNYDGDLRLCGNHKSQWKSFANAYSTFSASADYGFCNPIKKIGRIGIGFQFNSDIAGDAKFGTNHYKLSLAYMFPIKDSSLVISLGGNGALNHHGISFNLLNFGSQYDGESFDPTLPNNEIIDYDEYSYFDISAGFNITWIQSPILRINAGFSANHLNSPNKSFFEERNISLPIKYLYHGKVLWNAKDDFWLEPMFMIMHQQKYLEINLGSMFRIEYNPLGLKYMFAGAILRARDAGIFVIGGNYQNINIAISYDVNLSKLTTISRGKGGIEISLIYILEHPKPYKAPHYRKCPDFM